MRTIFKKVLFTSLMLVVGGSAIVFGQINLLSDAITFRETTNRNQTTTHNGSLNIYSTTSLPGLWVEMTGGSGQYAIRARSLMAAGSGIGGYFEGASYGVSCYAQMTGGTGFRYGGRFAASGGANNYGIWTTASSGSSPWAGYFSGNTWCTGTYQGSDEKLKKDVADMTGALNKIMKLQPKKYFYDTEKYPALNLPSEEQNGLIAQDVEPVFPEIVKITVSPSQTDSAGEEIVKSETFKSINYVALVPVLIKAMQEQQKQIVAMQQEIDVLKTR